MAVVVCHGSGSIWRYWFYMHGSDIVVRTVYVHGVRGFDEQRHIQLDVLLSNAVAIDVIMQITVQQ